MNSIKQTECPGNYRPARSGQPCSRCQERPHYVCYSGGDVVDADHSPSDLVDRLVHDWPQLEEDLIVVLERHQGYGPRVVCLLRADQAGATVVRWLY